MNFLSLIVFALIISVIALFFVLFSKYVNGFKKSKTLFDTEREFGFSKKVKSQQSRSSGFVVQALIFLPILFQCIVLIPWAFNFRQTTKWELHIILLGSHAFFIIIGYLLVRLSGSYRWED